MLLKRCRAPITRAKGGGGGGGSSAYVELADLKCGAGGAEDEEEVIVTIIGLPMRIVCCEPSSRRLLIEGGVASAFGLGAPWPGDDVEPWGFAAAVI